MEKAAADVELPMNRDDLLAGPPVGAEDEADSLCHGTAS